GKEDPTPRDQSARDVAPFDIEKAAPRCGHLKAIGEFCRLALFDRLGPHELIGAGGPAGQTAESRQQCRNFYEPDTFCPERLAASCTRHRPPAFGRRKTGSLSGNEAQVRQPDDWRATENQRMPDPKGRRASPHPEKCCSSTAPTRNSGC